MQQLQTTYHLLLEWPWIHHHKFIPSTYHKWLQAIWKGKRVHINAIESPFQRMKLTFKNSLPWRARRTGRSNLIQISKHSFAGMGGPRRPTTRPTNSAHTSTSWPGLSIQSKPDNKRARQGDDFPEKFCLTDREWSISCNFLRDQALYQSLSPIALCIL